MTFNKEKDLMSAWLHLLGLGLSIAGTVLLIIRGAGMTPWHVVSYAIFGATMIALYPPITSFISQIRYMASCARSITS